MRLGNWFLTIYLNPRVWAIDWHFKAPCCKFWAIFGPFEINRTWSDDDVYPFSDED